MDHGSNFKGLDPFRDLVVEIRKPPTKHKDYFISLYLQGTELRKVLIQ
jgi:hypothetical protein